MSLALIDDLDLQIALLTVQLKRQGADHRYIPLLVTAPGIGWINAYTIASEIGDIGRFGSPAKLCGYTRAVPARAAVWRRRRPRPALQARPQVPALGAVRGRPEPRKHPYYAERYQHTKRRLGRQRGPKVAQIDLARRLTEAIWHMLTHNQPFAPAGATYRLAA